MLLAAVLEIAQTQHPLPAPACVCCGRCILMHALRVGHSRAAHLGTCGSALISGLYMQDFLHLAGQALNSVGILSYDAAAGQELRHLETNGQDDQVCARDSYAHMPADNSNR